MMKNVSPLPFAGLKGLGSASAITTAPPVVEVVTETAPAVRQIVSVTPAPPARTDLLVSEDAWGWEQVRDFVVGEITAKFGPFPRSTMKEASIFKSFVGRYGSDATSIAQFAFGPTCNGWWGNAPISVNRFCLASDKYFGDPILERLRSVQTS